MKYQVNCYPDKHRKGKPKKVFVEASSSEVAVKIARSVSRRRVVSPMEYRPERDVAFAGWIRMVEA